MKLSKINLYAFIPLTEMNADINYIQIILSGHRRTEGKSALWATWHGIFHNGNCLSKRE